MYLKLAQKNPFPFCPSCRDEGRIHEHYPSTPEVTPDERAQREPPLCRQDLAGEREYCCGVHHDQHFFHPRCCQGAESGCHAEYCQRHGLLTLFCMDCAKVTATFVIAEKPQEITTRAESADPDEPPWEPAAGDDAIHNVAAALAREFWGQEGLEERLEALGIKRIFKGDELDSKEETCKKP